jgi:hypothetical protein
MLAKLKQHSLESNKTKSTILRLFRSKKNSVGLFLFEAKHTPKSNFGVENQARTFL